MMLNLLLWLGSAWADTWSAPLGTVLSGASDVAVLSVQADSRAVVTAVVRGSLEPGSTLPLFLSGVGSGATVLRACGYPAPETCVYGVERGGLLYYEDHSLSDDTMGHISPGASTLEAGLQLARGEPAAPLCARRGTLELAFDPATGRALGDTAAGLSLHYLASRIDLFDPAQPFWPGNAGHTTLSGGAPTWDGVCVTLPVP